MSEITLESLAARVQALEQELKGRNSSKSQKDWRSAVGIVGDSELMRDIDAEGQKIREAERAAARNAVE